MQGHEGGERLKQDRAEPHTFPLPCFYVSMLCLTGNVLHCFHENLSSSMVNIKRTINKTRQLNTL